MVEAGHYRGAELLDLVQHRLRDQRDHDLGSHRRDLVATGVHRRGDLLHSGHDRGQQARVLQVPDQHPVY